MKIAKCKVQIELTVPVVPNQMTALASVLLLLCSLAHSLHAADEPPVQLRTSGTTMGVVSYAVTAWGDAELQEPLEQSVADALTAVNERMSTYLPESEVSRFNTSNSTEWFEISPETAAVVHRAQEISQLSDGAFDITVQPLVKLWNFGPDHGDPVLHDAETVQAVLANVGYTKLEVRLDPPALRKSVPGLQIDLSAIAKGYAVDQVAGELVKLGLDDFLVEVGGEVRTSGEKPDGRGWVVGIEKPLEGVREPLRSIELYHKSLASSGDYRNFYWIEGQRFSHTIDPRTGYPVRHDVAAASVVASDCMTADAAATAIMVLGKDGGLAFAGQLGVQALVVERQADEMKVSQTDGFPDDNSPAGEVSEMLRMIMVASVFFLLAVIAMSVGVIFGGKRIKGSCGGIAALDNPDIEAECSLCSAPSKECRELKQAMKKRGMSD